MAKKQKGQLNLTYGEIEKNGFGKTRIYREPEEGDMYIFRELYNIILRPL